MSSGPSISDLGKKLWNNLNQPDGNINDRSRQHSKHPSRKNTSQDGPQGATIDNSRGKQLDQSVESSKKSPAATLNKGGRGKHKADQSSRAPQQQDMSKSSHAGSEGQWPGWGYPAQTSYDYQTVIDNLKNQLGSRQRDIESLSANYSKALAENDRLGEEVCRLQERSFNTLDDARWTPLEVKFVDGEMKRIRDSIWSLAKAYAAESLGSLAVEDESVQLAVRTSLEHIVCFNQDGPAAVLELTTIKHAPRLLLAAMISDSVHRDVLTSAFFFLEDCLDRHFEALPHDPRHDVLRRRKNPPDQFTNMFRAARACYANEANKWRSETLRLLNPSHLGTDDGPDAAKVLLERTHKQIEAASSYFARDIGQRMLPILVKDALKETAVRDQFLQQLTKVFVDAGKLSIRLWSQRPWLACQSLRDIAHMPFDVSSVNLGAHNLHKLEDDDHSLDGHLPKILVHPAILAFGTHEADHYERHTIMAKAVVWLEAEKAAVGGGLMT